MHRRPLRALAMRLVGHRVHTGRVDPAIVEIEERADGNREVERLVGPARGASGIEIAFGNLRRLVIHLVDESKQRLVLFVEDRRFVVGQDGIDEGRIVQKFRRNCGVSLQSKGAMIAPRRVGGNQFAQAGAERRGAAEDLLREACEMIGCAWQKREQMPDLRVLRALASHLIDERFVGPGLWILLHTREKHRLHRTHETGAGAAAGTNRFLRAIAISTRFAAGPTMKRA